jgi:molybdate transport system substrate-binding protein
VRILSTMAVAGVMQRLAPALEAVHRVRIDAVFEPTVRIMSRIRAGERADIAILTEEGIEELIASGVVEARTDLARSFVGVAVRTGAPRPDISTKDAFVRALLTARSIAMSQAGASGIFLAALLDRLGIAEQIRAKAVVLPTGYTAEPVARGEAELAIQQVSELMVVPGVDIVGRLPEEIAGVTMFSAGPFRGTAQPEAAASLIADLASPARAEIYRACGLEPVTGRSAGS